MASGRANDLLDQLAGVIEPATTERNLVDPATFRSDLERNLAFIADRIEYLETVAPIIDRTGG
jgi:hypothetical protein